MVEGITERTHRKGAVRAFDETSRLEDPQRLANGGSSNPVRLDQLALGGQNVSRAEAARDDLVRQPFRHEVVRLAALDRAECQLVRQTDSSVQ